jgi:hypothetical protein
MVKIKVRKHPKKKGYQLYHNQADGFMGCPSDGFGWYKYKGTAEERAKELERCWN